MMLFMKRFTGMMLVLMLLCSCAAADWTCVDPNCGASWADSVDICDECGGEAPIHDLCVTLQGDDFLRVQWYGYMADDVDVYYRAQGTEGWKITGATDKHKFNINGLSEGTTYEIMLIDWNRSRLTVTATTNVQGTPAADFMAQYNAAMARIAELENTVTELYCSAAEKDNALDSLIPANESLTADLAAAQTALSEAQASVASLQATVNSQAATIAKQADDLTKARSSLTTAQNKVDALQAKVNSQAETIAKQTAALNHTQVQVGQYVKYGHYPQTSAGNDETPIEWLVLKVDGNKALVLSRYGLDARRYSPNNSYQGWADSEIRQWLNGSFLNSAFTFVEQKNIAKTTVQTRDNYQYYMFSITKGWNTAQIGGGYATEDKIFLLSVEEAMTYGGYSALADFYSHGTAQLMTSPTQYALARGANRNRTNMMNDKPCCWWRLRSPGSAQQYAASVSSKGTLGSNNVDDASGVIRPAMWVNLDTIVFY